jgi:hypothetical protein
VVWKSSYVIGSKLGLTQTDKGDSSNLHLGFIHVSREIGYDNFLNRLRDGTSWFRGIRYTGLASGGCTGGSKDLSTCTVTTGPTLHMLSCVGSSDDLHSEQKKNNQTRAFRHNWEIQRTSSRDLSISISVGTLLVKVRTTEGGARSGLVGFVGRRGWTSERRGASNSLLFVLFYLRTVGVGINLISAASLLVTPVKSEISASPLLCVMSRTGRGGGRGGFGGRSNFGANNPPPMGLTSADIQAMSREQSALYPVRSHSPSCTFILTALRICS